MKLFLGLLWVLATGSVFYFGHDHYLCKIRGLCKEEVTVKKMSEPSSAPVKVVSAVPDFTIYDEGVKVFSFNGSPITTKGNDQLVTPDTLGAIPDSISTYLNRNLNKDVVVTLYYDPDLLHKNGASDSSVTADRLNGFVSSLKSEGVNGDKIITNLVAKSKMYSGNTSYNGLEVAFHTLSEEKLAKVDDGITNKTLYAAFGKGEFKADRTLANYALELTDYLKRNPTKNVLVTGHTDDVGESQANYNLGLVRARNVKNYLISRGVASSKIKSISKGESDPLNASKTKEARSLNRRIEVIVK